MTKFIRTLLVDDQFLIREGIASLLELEDGIVLQPHLVGVSFKYGKNDA